MVIGLWFLRVDFYKSCDFVLKKKTMTLSGRLIFPDWGGGS